MVKYNPPALLLLLLQIAPHAVAPRALQLVCSGSPGEWRSHRWGGWVRVRRGRLSTVVNGRGQPHGTPPPLPFYATLVSYFKPAATIDSFARREKNASRTWLVGCAERRWRVYRAIAACLARYRSGGCSGDGVVRSADATRLFLIYIQTHSPAALRAAPSEKDTTSGSLRTLALPLVCPPLPSPSRYLAAIGHTSANFLTHSEERKTTEKPTPLPC